MKLAERKVEDPAMSMRATSLNGAEFQSRQALTQSSRTMHLFNISTIV